MHSASTWLPRSRFVATIRQFARSTDPFVGIFVYLCLLVRGFKSLLYPLASELGLSAKACVNGRSVCVQYACG
jgi:hypothetical protein